MKRKPKRRKLEVRLGWLLDDTLIELEPRVFRSEEEARRWVRDRGSSYRSYTLLFLGGSFERREETKVSVTYSDSMVMP